jgi:subtilisin family serine protease
MNRPIEQSRPRSGGRGAARPAYVPGLLVVRVKPDVVEGMPSVARAGPAAIRRLRLPHRLDEPFASLERRRAVRDVVPVFATHGRGRAPHARASVAAAFAASVQEPESDDLRGINVVRLGPGVDLERVERDLNRNEAIAYVHRVPARWPATRGARPSRRRATAAADDPLVNRQWGLRAIRWFEVDPLPDARHVRVGVLDTGVDAHHPDLRVSAYSHEGSSAEDIVGHGTHVSGIIAARANNRLGITGICRCHLHVSKIFTDEPADDGEYYVDEVLYQRALNRARQDHLRVVNLSIGGTHRNQTEALLIRRLVDSGCAVVAAMGNEYQDGNPTEYPAAYDGVIAVGAVNETNRRAWFSNTGPHIHLVAPGTNILSTLPMKPSTYRAAGETEYAAWDGTSMAAPHVTAALALLLAERSGLSPGELAQALARSARKLKAMGKATKTSAYGFGLLDLPAALA